MNLTSRGCAVLLALAISGPALGQQKKTLAIVVKGLDNPFFTVMGQGCEQWNKENTTSEYKCVFTGPASSADETGEIRLVEDLINSGAAAIAISPSNAPGMANMLRTKKPAMPIMTIDADLNKADRSLRKTYVGTDNYQMGVLMAKQLKPLKPKGGTVCLQLGNPAADNINARAQGFRDTISGKKGLDRLKGEGGWKEVAGCPLFTNDQIDLANQQMADTFTAHADLDAFILVGGWAQFGPQAYAQNTDQVMPRLKSKQLVIIAGDTLAPQMQALKEGRSMAQIGQRPYEMGHRAPGVMLDLIQAAGGGTAPTGTGTTNTTGSGAGVVAKPIPGHVYTGLDVCTPKNADTCLKTPAK